MRIRKTRPTGCPPEAREACPHVRYLSQTKVHACGYFMDRYKEWVPMLSAAVHTCPRDEEAGYGL